MLHTYTYTHTHTGAVAAWAKTRYKDRFQAAWASSAPIHAVRDFHESDKHVVGAVGQECAAKLRAAMLQADEALRRGDAAMASLKGLFGAPKLKNMDFMHVCPRVCVA